MTKHLPLVIGLTFFSLPVFADGFAVDKVYHPYVEPMEQEIEWRVTAQSQQNQTSSHKQRHRFGYGRALGERWFGELYILGDRTGGDDFEVAAYELEARYQMTEQGEYWADWGLLFEVEKEQGLDLWEAATGLLVEKEHGRFSTAANFLIIQEWGHDIDDELETRLAIQSRFRYAYGFEPALELHVAEDTVALGPVFIGEIRFGRRRALHWELGFFAGLDVRTPDQSLRMGLEYGF